MGDRAPASFTLYHTRGHEEDIVRALVGYGFANASWQDPKIADVVEGARFSVDEASMGILEELGPEFEAMGVAYYGAQDGKYEYDGMARLYTPELGAREFTASQDGSIWVDSAAVGLITDKLRYANSHGEVAAEASRIIAELDTVSGRAWTGALESLKLLAR
jgi:hypothetical protein